MLAVAIFTAIFVIAGITVFAAGFSANRKDKAAGGTGSGKLLYLGVALCVVGIGLAIPGVLIFNNGTKTSRDASGGVVLTADQESGRVLFAQNCSTCHTLQASGSVGQTGPNLDYMHPPEALILNAIQIGRARGNGNMPAGLVTGNQAKDVASYVSAVAGQGMVANENMAAAKTEKMAAALDPKQIFVAGNPATGAAACGTCHILKAAGTTGATGPNLDAFLQGDDATGILEMIVDPNIEIAKGYAKGIMPVDYSKSLTKAQLKALSIYIDKAVHGKL